MEPLNKLFIRVRELGFFSGIKVDEGKTIKEVTHLFFANDTLFCQSQERFLLNLKCVMLCFQVVSGLNINLVKSKMVRLGNGSNIGR